MGNGNITGDPNQSSFLDNNIPTTASANQIATELERHYSTILLTKNQYSFLLKKNSVKSTQKQVNHL
jgi:hypothetical protein